MSGDDNKKTCLTGIVAKAKMGGASKSAHTGFVLQTKNGAVKLRREGGNPFYDDFFEQYENKEINAEGFDMEQYFLATSVKPTDMAKGKK
jgi:hypothetical protein